jgi:ABC-type multidrug transport system ATPase subunit
MSISALIGALTVRENLLYAARLRLPSSIPDAVKAARVSNDLYINKYNY